MKRKLMHQLDALEAKQRRRDPLRRALRLHLLGMLQRRHGKMREAVGSLTESAAIHEKVFGESHPSTAQQLSDLGGAHHALGEHAEAQRCLRRSIRIHEQHDGLESASAAVDLRILTESLEATGDTLGAASEFERILTLKLRMTGQDPDGIAEMQWELAHRYLDWGQNSRARELLLEAVATFERTGGTRLARGYEALARLEEENGCYQEALRLSVRAAKVWESANSENTLELIDNLEHQLFLLEVLGRSKDVSFVRDQLTNLMKTSKFPRFGR